MFTSGVHIRVALGVASADASALQLPVNERFISPGQGAADRENTLGEESATGRTRERQAAVLDETEAGDRERPRGWEA
jgi:hypothetical protein